MKNLQKLLHIAHPLTFSGLMMKKTRIMKPHIYKRKITNTGKYYIGKHNGGDSNYIGSGVDYLKDVQKFVKNKKTDIITEILEYVDRYF